RSGAELALAEPVLDLRPAERGFALTTPGRVVTAPATVLTTGGQSYPGSGTTGDGYRFVAALGHTILPPRPALAPITPPVPWVAELRGVPLPAVEGHLTEGDQPLQRRRGSLLFAHFGLSGPVILDVSRHVSGHPQPNRLHLHVNLVPGRGDQE